MIKLNLLEIKRVECNCQWCKLRYSNFGWYWFQKWWKRTKENFEDLRKCYVSKDESPNTEDGKTLKKLCKDLKKGLVEGKFLLKI